MNTILNDQQKAELERRNQLHEEEAIHYGGYSYKCKCGFQFDDSAEENSFEVDGVKYPFITNHQSYEGDTWWTEHERCPKCKQECQFSNGN